VKAFRVFLKTVIEEKVEKVEERVERGGGVWQ
jgi:hypothetical protein